MSNLGNHRIFLEPTKGFKEVVSMTLDLDESLWFVHQYQGVPMPARRDKMFPLVIISSSTNTAAQKGVSIFRLPLLHKKQRADEASQMYEVGFSG
jgi:hypothetical protein